MTLEEAQDGVGRRVIFTYYHGEEVEGTITSVGTKNVFVRFNIHPEACSPEQLRFSVL